ncbi:CLIP domain-containing serine protease B15 [Drosophila erecta]|uniref:Peptidase S1 domain-containing protein n=1 Tax=Drosophila erecta TaxID=7220 RepID=A0A0Q5VYF8_DROER|nr:CLIP domain-containing serine protease B15 [Drosophila erecta]KQS62526.1 uncharacterized protein Dere_GG26859 [Drosophila erecta]
MYFSQSVLFTILLWPGAMSQLLEQDCGYTNLTVHGQDARPVSNPWKAFILKYNVERTADVVCLGTLIHKQFVLSAARCIARNQVLAVRLGEYSTAKTFLVTRSFRDKNFAADYGIKAALLQIQPDVQFNAFIRPICIITDPAEVPDVKTFRAAGWKKTASGALSIVLKPVELTEVNLSVCNNMYRRNLTDDHICAEHQNEDTCVSLTGGPLMQKVDMNGSLRYVQLGIIRAGVSECRNPAVYTRLSGYIEYILGVVSNYTVSSAPQILV